VSPPAELVLAPDDSTGPEAQGLLGAMKEEMTSLYGDPRRLDQPALDPAEMAPPTGIYLIGRRGHDVMCGGGLRRLASGLAEIKRMYVVPVGRSHGYAGALLAALEQQARLLGYRAVRLDTGARQPHARALYERSGYQPVPAYNDNPYAVFWGEKVLEPEPEPD
jgi:GNAT superfamily N-acetyltransferase